MARCIREEDVTKSIINWLGKHGWMVVSFDFPQSGTGRVLHSNNLIGEKTLGSVIPDIIAIRNEIVVYFENKPYFYLPDFEKVEFIRIGQNYSKSLELLLSSYSYRQVYYGVGLPITRKNESQLEANINKVDFVINANGDNVSVFYEKTTIFI